jgi:hypothetical protein
VTNAFIFIQHEWVFVCVIPVSLSVSYPVLLFITICRGPAVLTSMQKTAYCCRDWPNSALMRLFFHTPTKFKTLSLLALLSFEFLSGPMKALNPSAEHCNYFHYDLNAEGKIKIPLIV